MEKSNHIAFDLGASSGRLIVAEFDGEKIELKELHRFANTPVNMNGTLHWDIPKLLLEIKNGLNIVKLNNINVETLAIDTWGVDFGYLDKNGDLLYLPTHYRDENKLQYEDELYELVSKKDMFIKTGVQPATINSVLQLFADIKQKPFLKDSVKSVLFTPDLFNYLLTGIENTDFTIASTSSLLSKDDQKWSDSLFETLGIPREWFHNDISYGKKLGALSHQVREELEIQSINVISASSHDTAASLLSVPKKADSHNAFLSCGTWSLLGLEIEDVITTDEVYNFELTNEGCMDGNIRLLKNINGLWLLQQLQRYWAENGEMIDFSDLTARAVKSTTNTLIDTNDERFMRATNMYDTILQYCDDTQQDKPKTKGEMVRIVLESLALSYAKTVKQLEKITNQKVEQINMFGGGIKNHLLCQLTANFSGKEVVTGPTEASAMGNIIGQLLVTNKIERSDIYQITNNSFTVKVFYPESNKSMIQKKESYQKLFN